MGCGQSCGRLGCRKRETTKSRNVITSEHNKSPYRDTAYIERANGRWEAWTYSETLKYRMSLPVGCDKAGAVHHLLVKKFDVVVVR